DLLHPCSGSATTNDNDNITSFNSSRFNCFNCCFFGGKTLATPVCRYTPSSPITDGSLEIDFITEPSGAIIPVGNVMVEVKPLPFALSSNRFHICLRRSDCFTYFAFNYYLQ